MEELDFIHDTNNKLSLVKDGFKIHSVIEGDVIAKNYMGKIYNNTFFFINLYIRSMASITITNRFIICFNITRKTSNESISTIKY